MDLGITGRTAVVCASTSELGEAIARALAAESAHVVVSGRRGERARQIAGELPSAVGGRGRPDQSRRGLAGCSPRPARRSARSTS